MGVKYFSSNYWPQQTLDQYVVVTTRRHISENHNLDAHRRENLEFHKIWNGRYSEETLPHINSGSVNLIVALTWTAFMATTLLLLMGWSRKVRKTWLQRLAVRVSFQTQKTVNSCWMRQTIAGIITTPQSYPYKTGNFDKNEATILA